MDELSSLALKYGSDKAGHHDYCKIYYKYLKELQQAPLVLLEIGIGSYDIPNSGGAGLKMFSEFFPNAKIYGIDIYDKSFLDGGRIETFKVSQTDEEGLSTLISHIGNPDIIIDDGSHINSFTIKSFEILFPFVRKGGFYWVEDVESSYWNEIAVDGTDFGGGNHPFTTMNYFKRLTDCVNYEHCRGRIELPPLPFIEQISSIHFHQQLILIRKK